MARQAGLETGETADLEVGATASSCTRTVAQVSEPAVSPISKSAARRKFERVEPANGTRVSKPASRTSAWHQTWKSALRQMESMPLTWQYWPGKSRLARQSVEK
jgi:hypothetical protein